MTASELFTRKTPCVSGRGIHLDLKGMPPTFPRLLQIVDLCAGLRINFILAEFEDTFPWSRRILRSKYAYSREQIEQFRVRCEQHNIGIIPLIQSYGHLENILSRPQFALWRENKNDTRTACPSKGGAREIIAGMLQDVLRLLPGTKYIHLGGDETFGAGTCRLCRTYVSRHGDAALYRAQLDPLIDLLRSRSIRPIVWHDALITWPMAQLHSFGERTDVMLWIYDRETWTRNEWRPEMPTAELLDKFLSANLTLWGAGAYRCGGEGFVPNLPVRAENMLEWTARAPSLRIANLAATGWSRGSFSRIAYGPMENAMDSLSLAAMIMWNGSYDIPGDIAKIHRRFGGLLNRETDAANQELKSLLRRLDMIYEGLHEDRGLRENRFGNTAAVGECLSAYRRERRNFSRVEALYRKALRGQAHADDIKKWMDGYRMAVDDRLAGLAANGIARGRYKKFFRQFLSS